MTDTALVEGFEDSRPHLRAVAHRLLGSWSEADDAVQEAWLRLAHAGAGGIDNLRGWLTTVVARICLDMLRARKTRSERPLDAQTEQVAGEGRADTEALMADSIGVAMLVVLERLAPKERVAFVLHDIFNVSFEEVAPIIGRSAVAARQLASRARRQLRGAPATLEADRAYQRQIVTAFLTASRSGDLGALLAVLDPAVVLRADAAAIAGSQAGAARGAPTLAPEIHGQEAVAQTFKGRAQAAQLALVDGYPGLVFAPGGRPRAVFEFALDNGRIVEINLIADATTIAELELRIGEPSARL